MGTDSKIILERRFVPKESRIVTQGEDGTSAFLIQSGEVVVYTESEDRRVELARLGTGQIFGETALIFEGERTASVDAVVDCNLIVITRQALEQKLERSDPMVKALVEMLSRRIVSSNNVVMRKQDKVEDMTATVRIIYQNIYAGLPKNRQGAFEQKVLPKLDEFLSALESFDSV